MSDNSFNAGQGQFIFPENGHYGAYPDNPHIDYDYLMSAPYGLDIGTFSDQFIQTFNTDFQHRLPWDYTPQAGSTPMATAPAPSMSGPSTSLNSPHLLRPVLLAGRETEQRWFGGRRDLDCSAPRVWWLRTPLRRKAEAQGSRLSKPEKKGTRPIGNSRGIAAQVG